jgi:hypothetical protein
MALPKIETPTFDLEVPSTKEKVTFRPWLVKEEKLLMLANESGNFKDMVQACKNVVHNCSYETLDTGKLTMFDLQHLFIRCKEKSVAGSQTFVLICGSCEHKIPYELKLEELKVQGDLKEGLIEIDDDIILQLKYPSVDDVVSADEKDSFNYIKSCLKSVTMGEEEISIADETEEEVNRFIDSLPVHAYNKMVSYFDTMPMMSHEVNYKCPECGEDNVVNINGAEHFFA